MVAQDIVTIVRAYLHLLAEHGIRAERAILFGSCVTGRMNAESDIDLVVIAPEFDGTREIAMVDLLWKLTWRIDSRLEPIPCGVREWERETGRIILDIARRDGKPVAA